jgi:hypothetical protein
LIVALENFRRSSDRTGSWLKWLTVALVVQTVVLVGLTRVLVYDGVA